LARASSIAGRVGDEIVQHARAVAALDHNALRQSADRVRRHERERPFGLARRVAPGILGDDGQAERLADDRERGPDRLPVRGRSRHQRKRRLLRQLGEFIGRKRIDRRPELDARFAIGLHPVSGRALPAVAHAHGERIAGAQIAAAKADQQRVRVGADVETVEPDVELGAVAGLDRGEVRRRGLVELRLAHVGGRPPRDFHHAGIVDAERARGVGQGQLGVCAGDKGPGWREPDRAHVLGEIGGKRHERTSIAASLLVGRKKDR
jgi:hypothetical protein